MSSKFCFNLFWKNSLTIIRSRKSYYSVEDALQTYCCRNMCNIAKRDTDAGTSVVVMSGNAVDASGQEAFTGRRTRLMNGGEVTRRRRRSLTRANNNNDNNVESLDKYNNDISDDPYALSERKIDGIYTNFPLSFNLAAYVNHSRTLQQLLKLGVDLSRLDSKRDIAEFICKLDFDRDIKKYIQFLHDVSVSPEKLGNILTKNPYILREDIDNLQARINYLKSKRFTVDAIARIISENPIHLSISTVDIDRKLGFLQREFKLTGDEVRLVTTRLPKLVTTETSKIRLNQFSLKEECGFEVDELRQLLKTCPKLWLIERKSLLERFDYIHNKMGISHALILHFPGCLLRRLFAVKQRHMFLEATGRSQYDPKQPCYVSLEALSTGTDDDFCLTVAKTSVEEFDNFLKTL